MKLDYFLSLKKMFLLRRVGYNFLFYYAECKVLSLLTLPTVKRKIDHFYGWIKTGLRIY